VSVLYILLPLALLVAGGFVVLFVWAARDGQFDDLETPAMRMLHDDRPRPRGSREEPPSGEGEDGGGE
jgi:cbb3-type cytochrome oxidase maturation protein